MFASFRRMQPGKLRASAGDGPFGIVFSGMAGLFSAGDFADCVGATAAGAARHETGLPRSGVSVPYRPVYFCDLADLFSLGAASYGNRGNCDE